MPLTYTQQSQIPNTFHSHHHLIPPPLQTNQPHPQTPHPHPIPIPSHTTITQATQATPQTMPTPKPTLDPPGPSPPTPTSPNTTAAAAAALTSLPPALDLLVRFHHRNKNQHRLSKWWAQADMLRRQVRKMITELEALEAVGVGRKGGGKRAAAAAAAAGEVVRRRAGYLRWRLGPGAFL